MVLDKYLVHLLFAKVCLIFLENLSFEMCKYKKLGNDIR